MQSLYQTSIDLLLKYQQSGGGYLACPNFPTYRYVWFRDGSFCAYALDLWGETQSADRFHQWVMGVLRRYQEKMTACIQQVRSGVLPPASDCLHSRFSADGLEIPGNWGHHQLDGLGTWAWAYEQHLKKTNRVISPDDVPLLTLVRDYLSALWRFPCSDCWEENEDQISTHSLGAVYAGLMALSRLLLDEQAQKSAEEIQAYIFENAVINGHLVKLVKNDPVVDANLLFLAEPYRIFPVDDVLFQATLNQIQKELVSSTGGVRRYAADTYYGGGEWVLLSACLGWVACAAGDLELARRQVAWIEAQAAPSGELPEQVAENLNAPDYLSVWTNRWGNVATPLLWSHAQYLILRHALLEAEQRLS